MGGYASPFSERTSSRYQWLLAALTLATLVMGAWGHWLYERARHPDEVDPLAVLYHSAQLLILHSVHLDPPIPWQLHAGRLLGVSFVFGAALYAFFSFFRDEALTARLWLPWQRGHVTICGLGDRGLRLALEARARGRFVVAIEQAHETAAVAEARAAGALVIEGDASDEGVLARARVERADFVVAVCAEDRVNVAIAVRAGEILARSTERRETPLLCRLLVHDAALRRSLSSQSLFPRGLAASAGPAAVGGRTCRVNLSDLDLHAAAARQALGRYPLDFGGIRPDDDTVAHLVVVGFDAMGRSLALHAARIGHFANEVTQERRLRLTVADSGARARIEAFDAQQCYAKLDRVCQPHALDVDCRDVVPNERIESIVHASRPHERATFAVCFEQGGRADDARNLRVGLEIWRRVASRSAQVLVHQSTTRGLAAVAPSVGSGRDAAGFHAFGMVEELLTWDTILRESDDQVARALHEVYQSYRTVGGVPDADNPGWDDLDDRLKDSNRQAADHIPIKLRSLGYHDAPLGGEGRRVHQFTAEQVLLLARLEHIRWCAERWLSGWERGDKDPDARRNPNLAPWDQLPPEEQRKDPEQIRAIIPALERVGRGVWES